MRVFCCAQLEDDFCSRSECKVIIFLNVILASCIIMQLSYSDKLCLDYFFSCRYLWQMFIPLGGKWQ